MKGLKNLIIQDNKNLGLENFKQADNILILVETKFSTSEHKKIVKKELEKLSITARALLHFANKFGKIHNVRDEISIYFLDDQIQKTEVDTCGIFQLYFYKNCL